MYFVDSSTEISGSYVLTVLLGVVEMKQNNFVEWFLFCSGAIDDDVVSPTCSLRDPATQDTDKPEIEPLSKPEGLRVSWASFK